MSAIHFRRKPLYFLLNDCLLRGSFQTYPLLRTSQSLTDAQVFKIHYHRLRDMKEIKRKLPNMSQSSLN